jgi:uncharacterized protein YndB with AHSA1/START domain
MASNNSFTLSREFDAPVEKVFEAWTDTEQLKQWIAPKGYSVIYAKGDIKAGGESHYCLASKHGLEIWTKKFFKDFIPPAKLSYTQVSSNEQGGIEAHPMIKDFPVEIFTTVMFDEKEGKTTVDLSWEPMNANAEQITRFIDETFELSQEWGGLFDQLESFLSN